MTPFCGGALINDRYVMTAAHCLIGKAPGDLEVIMGKHELLVDSGNDLRLTVSEIKRHPRYVSLFLAFDFALLRLSTRLSLPIGDNVIAPICLPYRTMYPPQPAVAAGWGVAQSGKQPDQLNSVRLRLVSAVACGLLHPVTAAPTMLCATGNLLTGGADTCAGDSGGPLTVSAPLRPNRRILLGLTSWGIGCALPLSPGVYARVPAVLDWVMRSTKDARYC